MKRLFLGFAPSPEQALQLHQLQLQCALWGTPVPAANLHMTLAFIGMVNAQQQARLIAAVDNMPKPCFGVTLDTLSHWPKPRILCLSGKATDNGLIQMASASQSFISQLGLHTQEYTYTPHITLSRKAKGMATDLRPQPLFLTPTELHLYHSHNAGAGVQYNIIRSWPLK